MLPLIRSIEDYRKIYTDSALWLPAVREIAARCNLPEPLDRQPLGTHIVFRSGDAFTIKIFCPLFPQDHVSEKTALTHIRNLPVPSVIHSGAIDGWPWLVMKRLPGVPAVEVWPSLPEKTKRDVIGQVGRWMRELHRTPPPPAMAGTWEAFIRERLQKAETHHGMPEPWRSWIREQLRDFEEPPMPHVLLHADITADHILLSRIGTENSIRHTLEPVTPEDFTPRPVRPEPGSDNRRSRNDSARAGAPAIDGSTTAPSGADWISTGLIDFGDARAGHPFYEFIAPLAFYTFGTPERSMTLLEAYGLVPSPGLFRNLTRYCLLHEFGTIRSFLDTFPARTPTEFTRALWGVDI